MGEANVVRVVACRAIRRVRSRKKKAAASRKRRAGRRRKRPTMKRYQYKKKSNSKYKKQRNPAVNLDRARDKQKNCLARREVGNQVEASKRRSVWRRRCGRAVFLDAEPDQVLLAWRGTTGARGQRVAVVKGAGVGASLLGRWGARGRGVCVYVC